MIDGIHLSIKNKVFADQLFLNPNFDFISGLNENTGEIKDCKTAEYKNLKINIFRSGTVKISGSLHKFKNNGLHNYNNFYFSEIVETINQWQKLFNFNLDDVKIDNLEFGVNITPPIPTKEILKNIVDHKREPFKSVSYPNSDYRECVHQQFIIKTYDKAKQYNQPGQILRIEVKYIKMAELNGIGINHLTDLLTPGIYKKLGQILINTWDEVLYMDQTVNIKGLTLKQGNDYKDWINPRYWQELTENEIKKKYNTEKKRYQKIIREYSENIQAQIRKLIVEKWEKLTNISECLKTPNQEKLTDNFLSEKKEMGKINHLYTRLIIPNDKKVCLVTGYDISMQKRNSKYLSMGGLKYLYQNDRIEYEKLKKERLTPKWENAPLKVQFREIAHNVRNEHFDPENNPRNNTKKSISNITSNPCLFDTMKFINPEKKKIAGI